MLLTEYDEEKIRRLFQKECEEEAEEKIAELIRRVQDENAKMQDEIVQKDEIIRSLKEQLAKAEKE